MNVPATEPLTVLRGGKVITCDGRGTVHGAIAWRGSSIVAVGRDDEIGALITAKAHVIDLGGRAVMPGMTDGHAHMDREGLRNCLPSLAQARCIDDILDVIAAAVRLTEPGGWILTQPVGQPPEYDDPAATLREGRFPDRRDLDRVSPLNPVYIKPIWGYWRNKPPLVSIANTAALRLARVDRRTVSPSPDVVIERDAQGEPTGVFIEQSLRPIAEHTLMAAAPGFTAAERVAGLRHAMNTYNRRGTTAVFEGHGVAGEVLDAYAEVRRRGASSVRATLVFSPHWGIRGVGAAAEQLREWTQWLSRRGTGDEWLRTQGVYAELDTEPLNNTLRAQKYPCTGWAGFQATAALPDKALHELLAEAARTGTRVCGIFRDMLPAFVRANKAAPIAEQRWVLGHQPVLTREMIDEIKDLGVVLTTHTNRHIWKDGDQWVQRCGPSAVDDIVPLRTLKDAGVPVAFGTDNLPVSLFGPVSHACLRTSRSGAAVAAGQALDRQEALDIATAGGAWLTFDEQRRGSLVPGALADLFVPDGDPLSCADEVLGGLRSLMTVVDGRIVHTDPSLDLQGSALS